MASDTQSHSYAFDGNGNPTTWKSAALTFDVENRMTAYGTSLTAGYNGDGLRAWKQDSLGNRTYFLYDGMSVIAETNISNGFVFYTWGADGLCRARRGAGARSSSRTIRRAASPRSPTARARPMTNCSTRQASA